MGSRDKKRNLDRAQKRRDWALLIEQNVTKKDAISNPIPEEVSIVKEEYEGRNYVISFASYLDNECEIEKMITNKDRDLGYALKILKIISNECTHYNQLKQKNFTVKSVNKGNQYAKLYSGLENKSVDVKGLLVYEAYIKTQDDGRMFFWSDEANKVIYIIAVRKNHY